MQEKYYIIKKEALPPVFEKVVEVKKLLNSEKFKTVNEATKAVGISRSAFYKYKDSVSVFVDSSSREILSLNILLSDRIGLLSNLLTLLSNFGVSILTINQNIPSEDIAPVTISMSVHNISCSVDHLIEEIKNTDGVIRVDLLVKN